MAKRCLARFVRRGLVCSAVLLTGWVAGPGAMAQVAVGDGGTPSYSQAIAVPPGVGGMTPKLSLLYAGGGVNGPLGHGWSVQGLSVITRCAATLAQDGKTVGVAYVASDKLCLDGQRLIQTDEAGNAAPSGGSNAVGVPVTTQVNDAQGLGANVYREFRTEKDMYARIRAYGYANGDSTGASGPAYFKVWTKAGQVYEYGDAAASPAATTGLIAPPGKAPMAWAVARISDTLGNAIDFKYEQRDVPWGSGPTSGSPTAGHEWNIREVQYSGNKVVFNYDLDTQGNDARTDKSEAYQQGRKNVSLRRLKSITTYVNSPATALGANGGTAVRTTQLTYDYGPVTGRSRIVKIQDCAGGPSSTRCLPATNLTYTAGTSDGYQSNAAFASSNLATQDLLGNGTYGVLTGDFNGDGKTDILYWSDTPSNNKLYTSNGDGSFSTSSAFNIKTVNLFKSDGCYYTIAADFNGDGITDLLRVMRATSTSNTNVSCGTPLTHYLYLGKPDGSFTSVSLPSGIDFTQTASVKTRQFNCSSPASTNYVPGCKEPGDTYLGTVQTPGANFHLIDVNGDGYLDIVTTQLPGYSRTMTIPSEAAQCASIICTRVYLGSASGVFTELTTTNLANHSVYGAPSRGFYDYFRKPFVLDVNGDGLSDLLVDTGLWTSQGNGDFNVAQASAVTVGCANGIDFNGDGRGDCLYGSSVPISQTLVVGDGSLTPSTTASFNLTGVGQELLVSTNSYPFPQTAGTIIADFNGDGRQDILRWKDDATQNALYLSNGDGSFTTVANFSLAGVQLQNSNGSASALLGDFTGRGSVEILRLQTVGGTATNRLFVKADPTPPDLLVSVTGPSGLTSRLYYVPLSNSAAAGALPASSASDLYLGLRYQSDLGQSAYAVTDAVDLSMPMYVVATQVDDTGVGSSTVTTEMSYRGLKADRKGRGMLGFREVLRQRTGADGTPLTVDTTYAQTHPYTGVAANTSTYRSKLNAISASTLLSTTSNAYCDQGNAAAASASANCPVTSKIARPYLYQSTEGGQDLAGVALPTVVTQNVFNGSGDPATISVTTTGTTAGVAQTFTKSVSNTYYTDNTSCSNYQTCYWILGRLNQATVTNTVPNSLASIPSSAGTGPYASATSGSGPAVSSPLNLVLSNCSSTTPTLSPVAASYQCQLGNSGTTNATNLSYATSSAALVINGPASCAANTTNCGTVTMRTSAVAGAYTGYFTVSSAGATTTSTSVPLTVTAPNGLGVSAASFSPATVTAGTSSTFNWSTTNAASASVSCAGTGVTVTGTATGTAGNITVGTTVATTAANCTVIATGASGAMVSGSADLAITPAGSVSVTSASFSPASVPAGTSSSFSWNTANATSASVSCSGAGANATGSGTSGTITVATSSAGTATCTVTAVASDGATATGSANLTVAAAGAPTISTSTFSAASVVVGGTSTFTWSASNATSTSASCSGAVSGSGNGTATGGSLTVTAGANAGLGTCTVTAVGPGGTTTGSANIDVVQAPTVSGVRFSPAISTATGSVPNFAWTTSNAASAAVVCTGVISYNASVPLNGSLNLPVSGPGTATCTVTASNGALQATGAATHTAYAESSVTSASFSPSSVSVGGSSTFSWATANASSATVSCSGAGATATGSGASGSITVTTSSAGTATCTVTSSNAAGATASRAASLSVSAPAPTLTTSRNQQYVTAGVSQQGVFSWTAGGGATSVTASCTGTGNQSSTYSGTSLANGMYVAGSTAGTTLTCTATASNDQGSTISSSQTFDVVAAPGVPSASWSPTSITIGGQSTLSWSGANAVSMGISCSGLTGTWSSPVGLNAPSGSSTFTPTSTGTQVCNLTATNAAGNQATGTASLSVTAAPTVNSAVFSPTVSTAAGSVPNFSWTTSNATSASVLCTGVVSYNASVPVNGALNLPVSGPGTGTCTVTAYNGGAQATGSATHTAYAAPSVSSASFSPSSVTAGSSSTFSWTTANASSATVSCSGAGATATGSGASGSINVGTSSAGTATCTVTAVNAAGSTAVASASLSAATAVPFTVSGPSGTTWTFSNPNASPQAITALSLQVTRGNRMGASISGGTCQVNSTVAAGGSCTVIVNAPTPDCTANNYSVAPQLSTLAGAVTGNALSKNAPGGRMCN
ncbi:FG-GAP-like repeat-containing protein [Roseateles puraquae]|nr:FG-GAP-like repeat-containing protein [Roseateles puraquae]